MKPLLGNKIYNGYQKACVVHDVTPLSPVVPNATRWWGLHFMVARYRNMHLMLELAARQENCPGQFLAECVLNTQQLLCLDRIHWILHDCWEVSEMLQRCVGTNISVARDVCEFLLSSHGPHFSHNLSSEAINPYHVRFENAVVKFI